MTSDNMIPKLDPAPAEKKARRRRTPEERIANREREIKLIQEKRRMHIRAQMAEAHEMLRNCEEAAGSAGMSPEADCCARAITALAGEAKKD